MTFCEDAGCLNIRWDNQLQRHVCDGSLPRPDGCPLDEEEAKRIGQEEAAKAKHTGCIPSVKTKSALG